MNFCMTNSRGRKSALLHHLAYFEEVFWLWEAGLVGRIFYDAKRSRRQDP